MARVVRLGKVTAAPRVSMTGLDAAVKAAIDAAVSTGVATEEVEKAKGLLWTAKTEQASANLSKSIDYAPLDMPVAEAEAALANARALGVLEEDEDEMVAAKVAEAKLAQAEKNLAAAVDGELLDIDVPAAKAAVVAAREAGMAVAQVEAAAEVVVDAQKSQAKRDEARDLLMKLAKRDRRKMDVPAAEAALEAAIAANVSSADIQMAMGRIQKGRDEAEFMAAQQLQAAARGYGMRREKSLGLNMMEAKGTAEETVEKIAPPRRAGKASVLGRFPASSTPEQPVEKVAAPKRASNPAVLDRLKDLNK